MAKKKAMEPSGEETEAFLAATYEASAAEEVKLSHLEKGWVHAPPADPGLYLHVEFCGNGPVRLVLVSDPGFYAKDHGYWLKTDFPLP